MSIINPSASPPAGRLPDPEETLRIRVAVVGVDTAVGALIVQTLSASPFVDVVATVGDHLGAGFPVPGLDRVPGFPDFDALVRGGIPIDALFVAASRTPVPRIVAMALAQKWHVVSEPLFARGETEATTLLATASALQLELVLLSARRFMVQQPLYLERSGLIPRWTHLEASWWLPAGPRIGREWHDDDVLELLARPLFDLTLPFFGGAHPRAVAVTATARRPVRTAQIEVHFPGSRWLDLTVGLDATRNRSVGAALALWRGKGAWLGVEDVALAADPSPAEPSDPPERYDLAGGVWQPTAPLLTVGECYARAVDVAVQAIRRSDGTVGDPMPAIRFGEQVRRAIEAR